MTYHAILHGARIEWLDSPPANTENLPVQITVEPQPAGTQEPNGARVAVLLAQLARLGTFEHISDPVAWQREIREDVKLPGRD